MGAHRIPPDCAVVPPITALRSTSRTVKPCACPASAAAQPPAPDPTQTQSTVVDQHVLDVLFLDPSRAERGQDVVGDMIVVPVRPRPVLVLLGLHVSPAVG